jgi:hypothetical protein
MLLNTQISKDFQSRKKILKRSKESVMIAKNGFRRAKIIAG